MVLSEEDLCKIECDGFFLVDQVDLSIGPYYYKFAGAGEIFRELLGSKVFKMVGIKCAEYEYLPQKKCLMSKDLNSEQIMYTPSSFGMKGVTLYDVYMGIERGRFNNPDQVKLSIEIMHFIDLLFSNIDRHISNFGFYIDEAGNVVLALLDNECFLKYYDKATRPMYVEEGERIDSMSFMRTSKKKEAEVFLSNISFELKELIPKYLEMFSPSRVESIITGIEMELGMEFPNKRYNMRKYKRNYSMICGLLKVKKKSFMKTLVK